MNIAFPTIPTAPVTQVFNNFNPAMYGGDKRHKGIDYGVIAGTPVYACMPGIVKTATNGQTGYGRNIRILHTDGSLSIYGHLSKLLVMEEERVTAGTEIGKSGGDPNDGIDGDGNSTGAHLHWEIRPPGLQANDQTAVDPLQWCLKYVSATLSVGEVISAGLNVRSMPNADAPRLATLYRKEIVHIAETRDGWGRLHSIRNEWVSLKYVHMTGESIAAKISPEPTVPVISDSEKLTRLWDAHPELH